MTMGVVFFAGCIAAIVIFGFGDAIRDWQDRRRIQHLTDAERAARQDARRFIDDLVADLFAHQLEEIRNLPTTHGGMYDR